MAAGVCVTTRRQLLASVATGMSLSLAGCTDGEDDDDEEASEPIVDAAERLENDVDPKTWHDVERIRLDAYVGGWVGVEPTHIDRVENPTLVLFEGRPYELVCENRDNVKHNLAIWDATDERIGEYATDVVENTGAEAALTLTASDEMATYICEHQPRIQLGNIEVVPDAYGSC
jgi:hypothetical protein